jgi:hypothetical protein
MATMKRTQTAFAAAALAAVLLTGCDPEGRAPIDRDGSAYRTPSSEPELEPEGRPKPSSQPGDDSSPRNIKNATMSCPQLPPPNRPNERFRSSWYPPKGVVRCVMIPRGKDDSALIVFLRTNGTAAVVNANYSQGSRGWMTRHPIPVMPNMRSARISLPRWGTLVIDGKTIDARRWF